MPSSCVLGGRKPATKKQVVYGKSILGDRGGTESCGDVSGNLSADGICGASKGQTLKGAPSNGGDLEDRVTISGRGRSSAAGRDSGKQSRGFQSRNSNLGLLCSSRRRSGGPGCAMPLLTALILACLSPTPPLPRPPSPAPAWARLGRLGDGSDPSAGKAVSKDVASADASRGWWARFWTAPRMLPSFGLVRAAAAAEYSALPPDLKPDQAHFDAAVNVMHLIWLDLDYTSRPSNILILDDNCFDHTYSSAGGAGGELSYSTVAVFFDGKSCCAAMPNDLLYGWDPDPAAAFSIVWIGRIQSDTMAIDQWLFSLGLHGGEYSGGGLRMSTQRVVTGTADEGYGIGEELDGADAAPLRPPTNEWTMEVLVREPGAESASYHRCSQSSCLNTRHLVSKPKKVDSLGLAIGGDCGMRGNGRAYNRSTFLNGQVAVVLVYGRALTQVEVRQLSDFYRPRFGFSTSLTIQSPPALPPPPLSQSSPPPPPSPPARPPSPQQPALKTPSPPPPSPPLARTFPSPPLPATLPTPSPSLLPPSPLLLPPPPRPMTSTPAPSPPSSSSSPSPSPPPQPTGTAETPPPTQQQSQPPTQGRQSPAPHPLTPQGAPPPITAAQGLPLMSSGAIIQPSPSPQSQLRSPPQPSAAPTLSPHSSPLSSLPSPLAATETSPSRSPTPPQPGPAPPPTTQSRPSPWPPSATQPNQPKLSVTPKPPSPTPSDAAASPSPSPLPAPSALRSPPAAPKMLGLPSLPQSSPPPARSTMVSPLWAPPRPTPQAQTLLPPPAPPTPSPPARQLAPPSPVKIVPATSPQPPSQDRLPDLAEAPVLLPPVYPPIAPPPSNPESPSSPPAPPPFSARLHAPNQPPPSSPLVPPRRQLPSPRPPLPPSPALPKPNPVTAPLLRVPSQLSDTSDSAAAVVWASWILNRPDPLTLSEQYGITASGNDSAVGSDVGSGAGGDDRRKRTCLLKEQFPGAADVRLVSVQLTMPAIWLLGQDNCMEALTRGLKEQLSYSLQEEGLQGATRSAVNVTCSAVGNSSTSSSNAGGSSSSSNDSVTNVNDNRARHRRLLPRILRDAEYISDSNSGAPAPVDACTELLYHSVSTNVSGIPGASIHVAVALVAASDADGATAITQAGTHSSISSRSSDVGTGISGYDGRSSTSGGGVEDADLAGLVYDTLLAWANASSDSALICTPPPATYDMTVQVQVTYKASLSDTGKEVYVDACGASSYNPTILETSQSADSSAGAGSPFSLTMDAAASLASAVGSPPLQRLSPILSYKLGLDGATACGVEEVVPAQSSDGGSSKPTSQGQAPIRGPAAAHGGTGGGGSSGPGVGEVVGIAMGGTVGALVLLMAVAAVGIAAVRRQRRRVIRFSTAPWEAQPSPLSSPRQVAGRGTIVSGTARTSPLALHRQHSGALKWHHRMSLWWLPRSRSGTYQVHPNLRSASRGLSRAPPPPSSPGRPQSSGQLIPGDGLPPWDVPCLPPLDTSAPAPSLPYSALQAPLPGFEPGPSTTLQARGQDGELGAFPWGRVPLPLPAGGIAAGSSRRWRFAPEALAAGRGGEGSSSGPGAAATGLQTRSQAEGAQAPELETSTAQEATPAKEMAAPGSSVSVLPQQPLAAGTVNGQVSSPP